MVKMRTHLNIAWLLILASLITGTTFIIVGCTFIIKKTISITIKNKKHETQNTHKREDNHLPGRYPVITDTPTINQSLIKNQNK